jgi:hypothetical protein
MHLAGLRSLIAIFLIKERNAALGHASVSWRRKRLLAATIYQRRFDNLPKALLEDRLPRSFSIYQDAEYQRWVTASASDLGLSPTH